MTKRYHVLANSYRITAIEHVKKNYPNHENGIFNRYLNLKEVQMEEARKNPYSEALLEIEQALWEHDVRVDNGAAPYQYDDETFRACLKIFMSALIWKLWTFMDKKSLTEKASNAENVGNILRNIILKFTGIDSHVLYSD